jgi:NAD(P)-dependent dehydrogenase (short-subunit alcohol dehydrogenase family)
MTVTQKIQYHAASSGNLSGKVALVTGGTRGIGKGIAHALAAAGAKVIISGRDQANAESVVAEIAKAGGSGGYLVADLFDDASVGSLVSEVIARFGKFDILVNNAGIDADALAMNYELEAWRRVMRFNLEVPFRLCQQAAQHFVPNGGGAIINIASVLAFVGLTEACSYAAAKHGLLGLTKVLAIEWGKQGVRVNAIAPGLIQTDMTENVWNSGGGADYVARRIPLGRIGQPRDIGGAVVFLASDAADFIHGETLAIDGGFLAT